MAGDDIHYRANGCAAAIVQHLHGLVTYGPWDLDVASAMSAYGYDAAKWAEGQGMLAELVSSEALATSTVEAALAWYEEAATIAQRALVAQPGLLAKLGLNSAASS